MANAIIMIQKSNKHIYWIIVLLQTNSAKHNPRDKNEKSDQFFKIDHFGIIFKILDTIQQRKLAANDEFRTDYELTNLIL